MGQLLIIIPAYNEAQNIFKVVNNLKENYKQYDYIVVNDGSQDETAKICRENGIEFLDLPVNIGLAGGVQTGFRWALKKGYDMVLQFDGDGQHLPEYISGMIDKMKQGSADIIIGSRFLNDEKNKKGLRVLGSKIIAAFIFLTTRQKISDPTSGMRLFNRRMIWRFANMMNYGPEPDTISYLIRCGAKVREVSVEMQEREAGESYLDMVSSIKYMIRMCVSLMCVQGFRKRVNIHDDAV